MNSTSIEKELYSLEQLIARLPLGETAPLARWRIRLESILAHGILLPAERAHLAGLVECLLTLERRAGKPPAQ